jgi:hypothetical protein
MFLSIWPARNQPDFRPMIEASQNGPKIGENLYGKGCRIGTMYENAFFLVSDEARICLMRIFWAFHYLRPRHGIGVGGGYVDDHLVQSSVGAGIDRVARNVSTTLRQPAFEFKLGFPAFGLAG